MPEQSALIPPVAKSSAADTSSSLVIRLVCDMSIARGGNMRATPALPFGRELPY
jgi:hypothetical protein